MDSTSFSSTLVGHFKDLKLCDDRVLRSNNGLLNSVPVKPRSEKNDVYVVHRKDALIMTRSAYLHFREATNAYLRGDYFSAKQLSMKAREEWHTAQGLHSKAAKEILSIKNRKNDIWRLDLHGLHAAEAIQALQEHLNRIESESFSRTSPSSNEMKENNGFVHSSLETPLKQRTTLQVITGVGKHSRGQPVLPKAVRSFLNENRYRFEEMRPGVIKVWPNFLGS